MVIAAKLILKCLSSLYNLALLPYRKFGNQIYFLWSHKRQNKQKKSDLINDNFFLRVLTLVIY